MRTIILDGDTFAFQAAASVETQTEWAPGEFTLHADLGDAKTHFDSRVNQLATDLSADRVVVALSDYNDPWRKKVMPNYKEHRKATRKPMCYMPLREYVAETRECFSKPGLEGDDVCGILLTSKKIIKGEKILVGEDKDLLTIPGKHLKLNRMKPGPVEDSLITVSIHEANFGHMMQTLTGDASDGYPGIPGVGPKKAGKILSPYLVDEPGAFAFFGDKAWPAVVAAYVKAGLTEADALMNARVARICRASDWDFKKKEVKLWHPPTTTITNTSPSSTRR